MHSWNYFCGVKVVIMHHIKQYFIKSTSQQDMVVSFNAALTACPICSNIFALEISRLAMETSGVIT